jgi:hypothetical protein
MKFQSTSITTAAFLVLSLLACAPRSALAGTTTFSNGVKRLIVLPSGGFTANMPNWMNSHAEAHHATIELLGAVRRADWI